MRAHPLSTFDAGVRERQLMYLQAVTRSSSTISDHHLAEIEKRKEEVKQVTRAGNVRDSRSLFEQHPSNELTGSHDLSHLRVSFLLISGVVLLTFFHCYR